jgi:hypothetical protein
MTYCSKVQHSGKRHTRRRKNNKILVKNKHASQEDRTDAQPKKTGWKRTRGQVRPDGQNCKRPPQPNTG